MKTTTKKLPGVVGLKELRENMESYIKRVQKGESLTIMRRGEPIFRITPVDTASEDVWETVIDFTEINPNGVPAKEVLQALQKLHG